MIELEIQNAVSTTAVPAHQLFELWAGSALPQGSNSEVLIRLVERDESQALNARYRKMDKPTNVLSFPADLPEMIGLPLLGDIVICAPLVVDEAEKQGKDVESHWAHLTVHGILHLLGHDHQTDQEAREMEALETSILLSLGLPDPHKFSK